MYTMKRNRKKMHSPETTRVMIELFFFSFANCQLREYPEIHGCETGCSVLSISSSSRPSAVTSSSESFRCLNSSSISIIICTRTKSGGSHVFEMGVEVFGSKGRFGQCRNDVNVEKKVMLLFVTMGIEGLFKTLPKSSFIRLFVKVMIPASMEQSMCFHCHIKNLSLLDG